MSIYIQIPARVEEKLEMDNGPIMGIIEPKLSSFHLGHSEQDNNFVSMLAEGKRLSIIDRFTLPSLH
jgi:hypothetical protein